jgi:predicted ArsR family transcriptional regulator
MGEVELTLEAQLQTTSEGTAALEELNLEREEIIRLCQTPMSVAELAGRLDLPLQVSRVLVGDLIVEGLIALQVPVDTTTERPDLTLLERVLDGLQKL